MPREPGRKVFEKGIKLRELLGVFCDERGISPSDIRARSRNPDIDAARRAFCLLATEAGIGSVLVGKAINRSAWTVQYHVKPAFRARKQKLNAIRRAKGEEMISC